ncbi:MAG: outer membrane beta-barrel family protein [Duncaniella sp.]|nr:outer membrane beta-barrel family protein [Duncaniella sp.]
MEKLILIISLLIAVPEGIFAQEVLDSLLVSKELNEVVVTAQRKYTRPTSRGLKVSMSGNPLSKIGSATDAIMQMPMIDGSAGSISVLGKGTPVIYINGRKMMDATELVMLKSSDLASVEIITNPSAEYGSDVSAVLLIKTKRPLAGLSVSAKGSATVSEECSESAGVNLQYHNESGVTVFGDFSYGWDGFRQKRQYSEQFKESLEAEKRFITISKISAKRRGQSLTSDGGVNYDFGGNSIGAKYIFTRTPHSKFFSEGITNTDALEIGDITSTTGLGSQSFDHYINAFGDFRLPFGLGLRADLDYMSGKSKTRWDANEEETGRIITNCNNSNHDYLGAKLRIVRRFGEIELETGAEYAHTLNNQDFTSNNLSDNFLKPAKDKVRQNLHAYYLSFDYDITPKWNIYGGLRYEVTNYRYERNGIYDDYLSRVYHDFLPNVGVQFKSPVNITMYYRAKVSRPSYSLFENNYAYVTPTLWETGNPELTASRAHNVGLSLYYRNFIFQGTYIRSDKSIGSIYEYNAAIKVNVRTSVNLPGYDTWQIVASRGFNVKFWHPTVQGVLLLQNLKYGIPIRKYNKPYYQLSLNNRFDIPGGVYAYLSAFYLGGGNTSTTYSHVTWQMALTLNKSYRNWTFTLSANDIFGTWKQWFDVNSNTLNYKSITTGASQYISLTVRYSINAAKGKYKGKAVREDEMNRF